MHLPINYIIKAIFVGFTLALLGFSSCNKTKVITPETSKTDLLTNNSWIIERYTYQDNSLVPDAKLNSAAPILKELIFQFRANNQVRAIVKINSQISNGGTWELSADEKKLKIEVSGLNGDFDLISVSKSKLVLRPNQKTFPIVDNNTVVNMEFGPSI